MSPLPLPAGQTLAGTLQDRALLGPSALYFLPPHWKDLLCPFWPVTAPPSSPTGEQVTLRGYLRECQLPREHQLLPAEPLLPSPQAAWGAAEVPSSADEEEQGLRRGSSPPKATEHSGRVAPLLHRSSLRALPPSEESSVRPGAWAGACISCLANEVYNSVAHSGFNDSIP